MMILFSFWRGSTSTQRTNAHERGRERERERESGGRLISSSSCLPALGSGRSPFRLLLGLLLGGGLGLFCQGVGLLMLGPGPSGDEIGRDIIGVAVEEGELRGFAGAIILLEISFAVPGKTLDLDLPTSKKNKKLSPKGPGPSGRACCPPQPGRRGRRRRSCRGRSCGRGGRPFFLWSARRRAAREREREREREKKESERERERKRGMRKRGMSSPPPFFFRP